MRPQGRREKSQLCRGKLRGGEEAETRWGRELMTGQGQTTQSLPQPPGLSCESSKWTKIPAGTEAQTVYRFKNR